jgi:hypothetical protein
MAGLRAQELVARTRLSSDLMAAIGSLPSVFQLGPAQNEAPGVRDRIFGARASSYDGDLVARAVSRSWIDAARIRTGPQLAVWPPSRTLHRKS